MFALIPYHCSCGARALVAYGEAIATSLMTALEASQRVDATLVLAGQSNPGCPTCGAAYLTADDSVVRVVERLAIAETAAGIRARN